MKEDAGTLSEVERYRSIYTEEVIELLGVGRRTQEDSLRRQTALTAAQQYIISIGASGQEHRRRIHELFSAYKEIAGMTDATLNSMKSSGVFANIKQTTEIEARNFLLRMAGITKAEDWESLGFKRVPLSETGKRMVAAVDRLRDAYFVWSVVASTSDELKTARDYFSYIERITKTPWHALFTSGYEPQTLEATAKNARRGSEIKQYGLLDLLRMYVRALHAESFREVAKETGYPEHSVTRILMGRSRVFSDEAVAFLMKRFLPPYKTS